jgi:hypothetical protein
MMLPNLSALRMLEGVPTAALSTRMGNVEPPNNDWVPFKYGMESMQAYSKRVVMQMIRFATHHGISLDNVHGVGFDERQILDMVAKTRTALVDPLEFDNARDLNRAGGLFGKLDEDDLSDVQKTAIKEMDDLMTTLKLSVRPEDKNATWQSLKKFERLSIIAQALTGTVWHELHTENTERFRLKLNITFGFYGNGLLKGEFRNEQLQFHFEDNMYGSNFRKTRDSITQAILQRHPNMELFNGTAVRQLFSDSSKLHCCHAGTGADNSFIKTTADQSRKRPRNDEVGADTLQSNDGQYLTLVHYGQNVDATAGDSLTTFGPIYASMSPRWKFHQGSTIFVLKVIGSLSCDIIDPSSAYAEMTILPGDGLVTSILPSLKIAGASWSVIESVELKDDNDNDRIVKLVFCIRHPFL